MVFQEDLLLIAPCGINCSVCMAYLREKNRCPGCRGPDDQKTISRTQCKMKTCETFKDGKSQFCFECDSFPCARLKRLDKRYREKYYTSLIENLRMIQESGISEFLKSEKVKWSCSKCGGTICMHKGYCDSCGEPYDK
ncbi:MAG: DUF3795 domain-containing protein [Methanolobus sp.]